MSSEPSDRPTSSPSSDETSAWVDAVSAESGESERSVHLPERREMKKVSVNEVGALEHASPAEGQTAEGESARSSSRLSVREIDGGRAGRHRPERPDVMLTMGDKESHAKVMAGRWEIESKEWSGKETYPVKWLVAIAVSVIGLIVVALSLLPSLSRKSAPPPSEQALAAQQLVEEKRERDQAVEDMLWLQSDAELIYEKFVTAVAVDDILPMVRQREQVEPLLRAMKLQPRLRGTWKINGELDWSVGVIQNMPCGILSGEGNDYRRFAAYFVLEDGQLLMDWKATVGYSSASYSELVEGRGDGSEIRGVLKPSVFYTAVYPEDQYQSFQLLSPTGEHAVWCYIRRDHEVFDELAKMFMGGGILQYAVQPTKVTLQLEKGLEGSLANQWLIGKLIHTEWMAP